MGLWSPVPFQALTPQLALGAPLQGLLRAPWECGLRGKELPKAQCGVGWHMMRCSWAGGQGAAKVAE